jgi:hypothetical protein
MRFKYWFDLIDWLPSCILEGNVYFRLLINSSLGPYLLAKNKDEKSEAIAALINDVQSTSPDGGFVRKDNSTERWSRIKESEKRDKVGHAVRKAIHRMELTKPKTLDRLKKEASSCSSLPTRPAPPMRTSVSKSKTKLSTVNRRGRSPRTVVAAAKPPAAYAPLPPLHFVPPLPFVMPNMSTMPSLNQTQATALGQAEALYLSQLPLMMPQWDPMVLQQMFPISSLPPPESQVTGQTLLPEYNNLLKEMASPPGQASREADTT